MGAPLDLEKLIRRVLTRYGSQAWQLTVQEIYDRDGLQPHHQERAASEAEALAVYVALFAQPFAWIRDPLVAELVVDAAVRFGPQSAVRVLARAVGLPESSVVTDALRSATAVAPPDALALRLVAEMLWLQGQALESKPFDQARCAKWLRSFAEAIFAAGKLRG